MAVRKSRGSKMFDTLKYTTKDGVKMEAIEITDSNLMNIPDAFRQWEKDFTFKLGELYKNPSAGLVIWKESRSGRLYDHISTGDWLVREVETGDVYTLDRNKVRHKTRN